jgi:hypothetical protein
MPPIGEFRGRSAVAAALLRVPLHFDLSGRDGCGSHVALQSLRRPIEALLMQAPGNSLQRTALADRR